MKHIKIYEEDAYYAAMTSGRRKPDEKLRVKVTLRLNLEKDVERFREEFAMPSKNVNFRSDYTERLILDADNLPGFVAKLKGEYKVKEFKVDIL